MRCPKCSYIGFDDTEACRNCGYSFTQIPRNDARLNPLVPSADRSTRLNLDEVLGNGDTEVFQEPSKPLSDEGLPLFPDHNVRSDPEPDGVLLAPRAPLSVRRATPEVPRMRTEAKRVYEEAPTSQFNPPPLTDHLTATVQNDPVHVFAPGLLRMIASAIDGVVLGVVDASVIFLTLRLCDLTWSEWSMLPVVPIGGFFLMLNGGYLVAFTTARGQTIGKMFCHLKVVGSEGEPVTLSKAMIRVMSFFVSILPLGLGFIVQFGDRYRRTLHDRLAQTRVVKVS